MKTHSTISFMDPALGDLLALVDDCDRVIDLLEDKPRLREGVRGSRERILRRFEDFGYTPVGKVGERFNPHLHEAVATEPAGEAGEIVEVYRRGWQDREGNLLYPAMVVVGS